MKKISVSILCLFVFQFLFSQENKVRDSSKNELSKKWSYGIDGAPVYPFPIFNNPYYYFSPTRKMGSGFNVYAKTLLTKHVAMSLGISYDKIIFSGILPIVSITPMKIEYKFGSPKIFFSFNAGINISDVLPSHNFYYYPISNRLFFGTLSATMNYKLNNRLIIFFEPQWLKELSKDLVYSNHINYIKANFGIEYSFKEKVQNQARDTTKNKIKKNWCHIGWFFAPTISFNLGDKVIPQRYDGVYGDYYETYSNKKENPNLGFSAGIEIEPKISKRFSISTGLIIEEFYYSGSMTVVAYSNPNPAQVYPNPWVSSTFTGTYYYKDYFLSIPFITHYLIFNDKNQSIDVSLGFSGGTFLSEDNSGIGVNEYNGYDNVSKNNLTAFGILGVRYSTEKKRVKFILEPRFTSQINTSPYSRRFASTGIKLGILF